MSIESNLKRVNATDEIRRFGERRTNLLVMCACIVWPIRLLHTQRLLYVDISYVCCVRNTQKLNAPNVNDTNFSHVL